MIALLPLNVNVIWGWHFVLHSPVSGFTRSEVGTASPSCLGLSTITIMHLWKPILDGAVPLPQVWTTVSSLPSSYLMHVQPLWTDSQQMWGYPRKLHGCPGPPGVPALCCPEVPAPIPHTQTLTTHTAWLKAGKQVDPQLNGNTPFVLRLYEGWTETVCWAPCCHTELSGCTT